MSAAEHDTDIQEVGHDTDGGAIWENQAGERWNAGDDHECTTDQKEQGA